MAFRDVDLTYLEKHGIPPLPGPDDQGFVENQGARIWYASHGSGPPVLLLHGGMGNSGNWGYQVPAIVAAGYRAIVIDSRGHGRSTRDGRAYSYQLMAADTRAVMDRLQIENAAIVGWSDGADTGLILAQETPERVAGLFFFACNVDNSGTKPFEFTPVIGRIWQQHQKDYARLSATPGDFEALSGAVEVMQGTQPNLSASDLAAICVPVAVVLGEHDEFIEPDHIAYLAATLPDATHQVLTGLSHFAPLQAPDIFNNEVLAFLKRIFG